jgi:PAS domain S-box-containing protein
VKGAGEHSTGRAAEARAFHEDERFRSLADTAPAMLWVTQPDGSCSFLSRAWYEFTGQSEGASLGGGWLDAVHPGDRERSDAAFAAATAKCEAFAIEYRLRRRDGSYRWVIDAGRARFDGEQFLGYVGSVIDITERKRSELLDQEQTSVLELVAARRPIEECLRAIAEAATRLAPSTLACGVIVEDDLRQSTVELVVCFPQALGEALCEAGNQDGTCHSTPVLGRGGRAVAEFRLWLPESRAARDWELRVAEFGARATGIALERERAAAALLESDTRFRIAADAAGTVVYDVDATADDEEVAEVHGLEHLLGGPTPDRLTNAWWHSRIHPDDSVAHHANVQACLGDVECPGYRSEYRVQRFDGSWRNVEDRARIRRHRDGKAARIVGTIHDVTDRKQAELELRHSREQLQLLSDTVPALISYIGTDRCYRTCNAEYSKWFGLTNDEIVGRSMHEVLGPDAWRVVGPHIERAFAGEPSEYEADVAYRRGGKRSVHARYTPHRDADGTVVGVVCLVTDVTARRQAGHARARLAAIVDCSDEAIISKTLDGVITSWNNGATRLFGYTADEAVGRHITMLIPESRRHEETKIIERIGHGESVEPYETVRQRKDGSLFDVSLSVSPIIGEGGRIVGASKIARDITARKRAQEDVRRSREALNGLVDRAPFGIYIVDSQLTIVQMNARSQTGTFYNVRPVIGRNLVDVMRVLWPEPVATEIVDAFRSTLETGESFRSRNFSSPRADTDNVESYEWELHRITLPDGQTGVVCYYFDSTRLRRAEHGLREADRRKDEFLATLAHELRNPLAPIRNGLQILRLTGADPTAVPQIHEMLERQVNHLVRLVDDLMEVARVTRGRIELRKEAVDLGAMVRSAVDTSRPLIEAARHELVVESPAEPVTLVADPVRLAQVIANLLNNAAKYTEEGGRITVSARREDDQAVVAVRDSGIGIPADVLPRVFDLFAQADRTYHRAQGGLGIGLTLARTLVELHGGTVAARSEGLGHGSEFIVRLPLGHQHTQRSERGADAEDSSIFAAHRFLVVDDSLDAAQSLAMLLENLGADVHTAVDGPTALDDLETYRPSVVLLDIGMPGMDGLEVARRARQRPESRDLTLIALSGWGQEADRRRSREAGIDYHLVKPVDLVELGHLLTALAPAAAGRLRMS